ncbi:MAG: hypothetical protein OXG35_28875 [Acidobacteria bacterium]|nr:hypothetical protein [Acidobacteriota bacterium]
MRTRTAVGAVIASLISLAGCSQLFFGPASGPMQPSDWLIGAVVLLFIAYCVVTRQRREP